MLTDPNAPAYQRYLEHNGVTWRDGYLVPKQQMKSNTTYKYDGIVATFQYRDALIKPDGSKESVYVDICNVRIHTGAANAGKSTSTKDLLAGTPTIVAGNGKKMSARVLPNPDAEGSDTWRYGLEAEIRIFTGKGFKGTFVTGMTGMTIDRSGTTSYKRIPNSADYDYFSESVSVTNGTPVVYPAEGYGATTYTDNRGNPHIVGDGRNGSQKTGVDGKKWDDSFLSGFLTVARTSNDLVIDYRGSGGIAGDTVYKMNTSIFAANQSFPFEASSGEGGTIQFTKNGGDLTDGSAILGPGRYFAPRGKSVRLTMTPDQPGMHPELIVNGTEVTANVQRHEADGKVYFTYDVPAAFAATTAEATWVADPAPAPTGELALSIFWDDMGHPMARPDSVNAHITAKTESGAVAKVFNGVSEVDVTLAPSSPTDIYWSTTMPNLPVTYNGETVIYHIAMPNIPGYTMTGSGEATLVEGTTTPVEYYANSTF